MPKPDSLSNVLLTMFDLLLGCPEVHSGSACRGDSALAADNLFLRKQLALYLERHKAPCAWLSHHPLPPDVGEAIADYLRTGRPPTATRCVFLRARAPVQSFKGSQAIDSVVRHALARVGIDSPRKGAHQFRHGLACQMLRQGASLS